MLVVRHGLQVQKDEDDSVLVEFVPPLSRRARLAIPPPPRAAPSPHAALLAQTDCAIEHLSEQVRNARVQGVMDAAAQWENYLTHVTTLKDQMGTGDPQVTEGGNPTAPFAAFAAPYDNA